MCQFLSYNHNDNTSWLLYNLSSLFLNIVLKFLDSTTL